MSRYGARDVAVDFGFNAALVLLGALIVWLTGWSRFGVYVVVLTVGWSLRAAAEYWLRRRRVPVPDRSPTSPSERH
ncbi:hypothetical protein O2V63_09510 [Modestobacter sp. VKM Ac-2977]|uniref:hypothetical protein n=1 Tax=Modestobacter sp. VKM Ac-2977 TaxID=3004131 RepID=UPI0022AA220D|nr:hypothetical protein [Modestobacter sp. VKM Ac-2977]MCZ2820566.1 hypothetical protein [Modestobacter sp. VKM Ac-2977]